MEKYILKNGLEVTLEKANEGLIAAAVFVKVGSRNEKQNELGYSHIIEHMIFSLISEECREFSCEYNAITTKEYTCYYIICLKEDFNKALDVLLNIWREEKIFGIDIWKEIKIIKQEIELQEDDLEYVLDDTLLKSTFGDYGLGNAVSGKAGQLDEVNLERLKKYYTHYYCLKNSVLSINGNIESGIRDVVFEKLSNRVKFEKGERRSAYACHIEDSDTLVYIKGNNVVRFVISLDGIGYCEKEEVVYDLCSEIIGGCNNSILYNSLRKESGLVYNVYTEKISYLDSGIIYIYLEADCKVLYDIIDKLEVLFKEEIVKRVDGIMISRMKKQLAFDIQKNYLSGSAIMTEQGLSVLLERRNRCDKKYIEKIQSIDNETVYNTLERILNGYKKIVYLAPVNIDEYIAKKIFNTKNDGFT